jgi:hypothetical protein
MRARDTDEEEEHEVEEVDPAEAATTVKTKGRRQNKATAVATPSTPTEVRVKGTTKEDVCLAKGGRRSALCSETYWMRVKTAFDERKFIDPYFQPIHMDRGSKAMRNHWGVIQAA